MRQHHIDKFIVELNDLMDKYDLQIVSADMDNLELCPREEFLFRLQSRDLIQRLTSHDYIKSAL